MPGPTLSGFQFFIENEMDIDVDVLPLNSPYPPLALAVALAIVNPALVCVSIPSTDSAGVSLNAGGGSIYNLAVYNLAADNLVNYAQDLPDAEPVEGSVSPQNPDGLPLFAWMRYQFNINGFVPGVISSANDETTGDSYVVQEAAKYFTLKDLQNLKTPWGRTYLSLAQSYGPTPWGIS